MDFKAFKPDTRILILQIILTAVLGGSLHTDTAMFGLFLATDLLLLYWFGFPCFLKNLLIYGILYGIMIGLYTVYIPVLSFLFPPFFTMIFKIYPAFLSLKILLDKAPMDELLYSLDHMHIPKTLSIPFMVVYRYVPTLSKELQCIHESLKMRGMNLSFSNLKRPVRTLENYIVPLLYRSEKIAEELSAASLCKGLSASRARTCCTDARFSPADFFYLTGMAAVTGFLCFLNHLKI